MKKIWTIIFSALLICSCSSASKENPDKPDPENPAPVNPELSTAISEDFSVQMSSVVECNIRPLRHDFRYYPQFQSITERNKKVMFLRIDPTDAPGINRGPSISSKKKCHYGSYSVNFRAPNAANVQPNLGVCAGLYLTQDDKQVSLEIRLSDPEAIYLVLGDEEFVVRPEGFRSYSEFYAFGIDWSLFDIVWWMKTADSNKKVVLKDVVNNSFREPAVFSFNYYHSKLKPAENKPLSVQVPYYPYELELSKMEYKPSDL